MCSIYSLLPFFTDDALVVETTPRVVEIIAPAAAGEESAPARSDDPAATSNEEMKVEGDVVPQLAEEVELSREVQALGGGTGGEEAVSNALLVEPMEDEEHTTASVEVADDE